jgi:hypothetical protein
MAYICCGCGASIEAERFSNTVYTCTDCGVHQTPEHECYWDEETGDDWCEDYMQRVTDAD